MMSQRFSLFYAGYAAYAPSLYYNQLSLARGHASHQEEKVKSCIKKLTASLKDAEEEYASYIRTAINIAKEFEVPVSGPPATYSEYFPWLSEYTDVIEKKFPMSRIDHYYFLYSRKLAEIMSNLGLINCYISLHLDSEKTLDLHSGVEKSLKDIEYTLFKLIASAALLSSEPRHGFFNANYKKINADFGDFKDLHVNELPDHDLKALCKKVNEYSYSVKDGLKSCMTSLKELQL